MLRKSSITGKTPLFLTLLLVACVGLQGCGEDKNHKLKKFIKGVKSRTAYAIEPLPKQTEHHTYKYPGSPKRNPFNPIVAKRETGKNGPDQNRVKQPLEVFALDSLRMVGVLKQHSELWAVISAPDGGVYRVKVGSYLGQNYGRVTKISDKNINITETVSTGGLWEKRPAAMALVEGE